MKARANKLTDALEARMDERYDALKAHTDERYDKLKARMDERFDKLQARMDERLGALERRILDLEKDKARLDGFQEVVSEWSALRTDLSAYRVKTAPRT